MKFTPAALCSLLILCMQAAFAQQPSDKKICDQYPSIEDNFTVDKDNYHFYYVETLICTTDEFKNADKSLIYSILLSNTSFAAPTFNTAAVLDCGKVICNLGAISIDLKYFGDYLPGNDPIVMLTNKSRYNVTNYTLPEHRLHAGKVIRSIIQRGNSFYITSQGTGNNRSEIYGLVNANVEAMELLWHTVDGPFVAEVRKKLSGKTNIPPPAAPAPTKTTFKIKPADITHGTDKDFKWYDWKKAPQDFKIAAQFVRTQKTATLKQEIENFYFSDTATLVQIAAIDLDNDGVLGFVVFAQGFNWCGTAGCTFGLYENAGLKTVDLGTDHGVDPANNGVTASTKRFFPLIENKWATISATEAQKLIALFTYPLNGATPPANKRNLIGGSSPEELGRLLVKALQTNDKNLWASCVHPEYDLQYNNPQHTIDQFDKIRDRLEEKGLSDWKQVTFSRVIFERCDRCAAPGEKWLTEMAVEFWYKNKEFLAGVAFSPVMTMKGKYFIGKVSVADLKRATDK